MERAEKKNDRFEHKTEQDPTIVYGKNAVTELHQKRCGRGYRVRTGYHERRTGGILYGHRPRGGRCGQACARGQAARHVRHGRPPGRCGVGGQCGLCLAG